MRNSKHARKKILTSIPGLSHELDLKMIKISRICYSYCYGISDKRCKGCKIYGIYYLLKKAREVMDSLTKSETMEILKEAPKKRTEITKLNEDQVRMVLKTFHLSNKKLYCKYCDKKLELSSMNILPHKDCDRNVALVCNRKKCLEAYYNDLGMTR